MKRYFSGSIVPKEYRRNFIHLYFDMLWFGILSGSAVSFLNVYATRLGGNGFQIGLLTAVPAVVSLVLSIPAGNWLHKRPVGKAVFWTAAISRIGYLFWIPLPWLLNDQGQIWALIMITLAMGIPMCVLGIGFNALFAASVPADLRALVVGRRNIIQSVTFIVSSIGAGYILNNVFFPAGYQVIFAIGFFSAAMSTIHLYFIRPQTQSDPTPALYLNQSNKLNKFTQSWRSSLRLDIWKTPYRNVLIALFVLHFAQYLPAPLFPLFVVNQLHLTDANIGLATAFFYLTVLIGSTQLRRMVNHIGHKKVTGWGMVAMSIYPLAMSVSKSALHYYLLSIAGGLAYAMVGGAYANYLLESVPENDRPIHLAWYSIILNAAVLISSLVGPYTANYIKLAPALFIFGIMRIMAGLALLKWG